MSNDKQKAQTEFRELLGKAGFAKGERYNDIGQAEFAKVLGLSATTVSRWLTERDDGFPPPRYAILFLRAYVRLNAKDKAAVLAA